VKLEVLRGLRALTVTLTPAERTRVRSLSWAGTAAQAQLIRTWLERDDFQPAAGQRFRLEFYENFHGIETVL
jgi:hypothetical protein